MASVAVLPNWNLIGTIQQFVRKLCYKLLCVDSEKQEKAAHIERPFLL
jgi:hypothetical protein